MASQLLKTIIDFKSSMSWKLLAELIAVKTSQRAEFLKLWGEKSIKRQTKRRYTILVFQLNKCNPDIQSTMLHGLVHKTNYMKKCALYCIYYIQCPGYRRKSKPTIVALPRWKEET